MRRWRFAAHSVLSLFQVQRGKQRGRSPGHNEYGTLMPIDEEEEEVSAEDI
jgi:hypothetical protein